MAAAGNFRGLRREVAVALRGRKRTLYETSKALGRRPGDIQRALRQMHAEGQLKASDPKPVRGTLFWFNEEHAEALEVALAEASPPGQITAEQRLLAIVAPQESDPYLVLERGDLNGAIAWVVEWGGEGELLIGLAPGTPERSAKQLVGALREADIKCTQRRVGEVSDGEQLRRDMVAVREARAVVRESEESSV
jgi:hypothetical protein